MSDPIPMRPLPARRPPHYHADELIAGAIVVERRRLLPPEIPLSECARMSDIAVLHINEAHGPNLKRSQRRAALIHAAAILMLEVQRLDETRERVG